MAVGERHTIVWGKSGTNNYCYAFGENVSARRGRPRASGAEHALGAHSLQPSRIVDPHCQIVPRANCR